MLFLLPTGVARMFRYRRRPQAQVLTSDLELAHGVASVRSCSTTCCIRYPDLVITVYDYPSGYPEMVLMCIINRENSLRRSQSLLATERRRPISIKSISIRFARFHFIPGAQVLGHLTLVLDVNWSRLLRSIDWDT